MENGWVVSAYWICLFFGIGYTVVSAILGGIGGHGDITHLAHIGDVSHDMDGHAGGVDGGETGQVLFGPFSPLVIAFFLTCFGASGIVATGVFHAPVFISLPIAASSGFLLAWLLIAFFNNVLGRMQSSSEVKLYALIGTEGEVTVDIPANGIGEIAYVAMGSRCISPARSEESTTIPRFAGVRITRMVGNMFYVRPMVEEQLRNLDAVKAP